jgi:hypothetical protein
MISNDNGQKATEPNKTAGQLTALYRTNFFENKN